MKNILNEIYEALCNVFETYIFNESDDLIPIETHKILNHPEDRIKYINALDSLRSGNTEATIELHTGKVLTIYSGRSLKIL